MMINRIKANKGAITHIPSVLRKNFGYMFIFGLGITLLQFPARWGYYGLLNGNYFLNVSEVTVESPVASTEDAGLVFCRSPRARIVAERNVRTYFVVESGVERVVSERTLPDGIVYERFGPECQALTLRAKNRPSEPGVYRFCQEFEFTVNGFDKSADFCSDTFSQTQ